nr:TMV resistance protein N-like [Ipomoea batatas]
MDSCKKLKVLPKLSHSVENLLFLSNCVNLYMIQDFPPILTHICLYNCKNLQTLPQLPPNLERINLSSCKKLKMIPQLPQKLTSLEARNCVSLEKVPNLSKCSGLYELDFSGCRKLKEIQGWENLHSLWILKLGGTPHNIVSNNNIKELLIGPKLESDFTCTLTCNEVPSWIRCKEEGSLLSFQWPLNNSENYTMGFLGLFFWVVLKARALPDRDVVVSIQINGLGVKIYGYEIQYEVEEISFLHWSPRDDLDNGLGTHIKVGEVMKVTIDETQVKARMVKRIGVVALYRNTDGFVQFVPITKVGLTTKKRKRNFRG